MLANFGCVGYYAIPLLFCYSLLGSSLPGDCSFVSIRSPYLESELGETLDHQLFSTNLRLIAHCHRRCAIESRNSFLFVSG